ncbi:MAG TPA: C39 family peptidase [Candidatus Dormibacteraeota bacterium]|nr:C39 family peptidase [Candidatus Dormibacteraeota bacterium]
MTGLGLPRRTAVAAAGGVLLLAALAGGFGVWLHGRPVLHVAASAQECITAPDHVASLFSDDQSTLIRISNLDYSDLRVLRVEPAGHLPGMFDSLLALSGNSARLAYVTADDELMDGARIQYLDVATPQAPHALADVPQGLAPVRPAWSPDATQLAYVIGRAPADGRPAAFEVWAARTDGSLPPQKVTELPVDVFARGHSASLCWTAAGQIGLLQGVQSAAGPVGATPLTGAGAASAARTAATAPSASPTANGSPCGVPVFSQNDPTWRNLVMQAGGDAIGGYGCALTSTTMLLNYYGAVLSPAALNTCLGAGADPIVWSSAPVCTAGKVQGGIRNDFSWDLLDAFLKTGKPVIVGMVRGLTGMHFVVVTEGGGGEADSYRITDPWDGSTVKTLGSYTNVGYNPRWIVSYDGPGKNCARLVPVTPPVQGIQDGGTTKSGVTISVPPDGNGQGTVVQVPTNGGGGSNPPSTSPSPSAQASGSAAPSPSESPSPSASPTATPGPSPSPSGSRVWQLRPGVRLTLTGEGIYQIFFRRPGSPPRISILKFTIDRTPPVLSLQTAAQRVVRTMAYRPDVSGLVLERPGRLRLAAQDTLSGVDRIDYRLDGAPLAAYSDDVSFVRTLTVPQVGTHTISIRATDVAGNVAALSDQTFEVVDTATPSPSPSASPTPTPRRTPTPPARTPTPIPTQAPTPTPPPSFSIVSPTLSVTPPSGQLCPVTYTITGQIRNTGGPGVATYLWNDLDEQVGATQTISFNGPGTVTVSLAFTLPATPGNTTTISLQLQTSSPQFATVRISCVQIG